MYYRQKDFSLPSSWQNPRTYLRKFRNSFLTLHWLWPYVIKDGDYDSVLEWGMSSASPYKKLFLKIFRFWPRVIEAGNWAKGDIGVKGCDPADFKDISLHSEFLMQSVVARSRGKDDKILDLGCNCGRFLAYLARDGYNNLYGVDISKSALEKMQEWFPETSGKVNASHDLFQRYLLKREDQEFDITFTHGATIELVHPSFPIVREVCRVTKNYAILMINENDQRFPHFWEYEFLRNGFVPVEIHRPVSQLVAEEGYTTGDVLSLMVFRRA